MVRELDKARGICHTEDMENTLTTLYLVTTRSLFGGERTRQICASCRDHAQYLSRERTHVVDPFECENKNGYFVSSGTGTCDECESRERSEAMIIANIEGIPYSRALGSIRKSS